MKRFLGILFLLLAFSCKKANILPPGTEGKVEMPERVVPVLPPDGSVPEIRINIKESDWKGLLQAYRQNNATQEYIPCDISYADGTRYESVARAGIRLKGNTSRKYPGLSTLHHVHFGLHFNEYREDGRLMGLKRLDLKWFKDDPAYCREIFCYDLFQRCGVWTAPTAGYTRLWLNIGGKETYMGMYILLEHVRGDYLKHRKNMFQGSKGHLWKAHWGATFRDQNAWMGADDNKNDYTYELKTDPEDFQAAKAQLQNFILQLNTLQDEAFYAWAREAMDVPLLLKTYAVNVAVGMWDDYWNNTNNFYFYFNPAGKFYFIPYDYDNTLGTSAQCGVQSDSGRQSPLRWGSSSNPLITKLLKNEQWKKLYISYLQELCAGEFYFETAGARIKAWQDVIGQYVPNDTHEDMVMEDKPAFWSNHSEYRLLTPGKNNFFQVKAGVVTSLK